MSLVRNLPIARKFTYAFGIISLLCVGLAGYTFFTLRGISAMASDVRTVNLPSVVDLSTMRYNANNFAGPTSLCCLCSTAGLHRPLQGGPPQSAGGIPCRRKRL